MTEGDDGDAVPGELSGERLDFAAAREHEQFDRHPAIGEPARDIGRDPAAAAAVEAVEDERYAERFAHRESRHQMAKAAIA